MKNHRPSMLIAAALLVLAAPLTAQTTGDVVDQNQETRTNPDAEAWTDDSGLTITGTVESFDGEMLVLRTSTGLQHVRLVEDTASSGTYTAGQRVAVDYNRTEQGVMIARQIRPWDGMETSATVTTDTTSNLDTTTTTTTTTTATTDLDTDADLTADVDSDLDVDVDVDTTTTASFDTDDRDELPRTGSTLPLLALGGLLAVGGAAGLRFRS